MRLRVISARNEIPNINPNEKTVHLAFRASNVDFLKLMQRCPRLRMIQVPPVNGKIKFPNYGSENSSDLLKTFAFCFFDWIDSEELG